MDNLVSILKIPVLNHDVKNKILRLVQNWAVAFEGKGNLSYVGEIYRSLQNEGTWLQSAVEHRYSHLDRIQLPTKRPDSRIFCHG